MTPPAARDERQRLPADEARPRHRRTRVCDQGFEYLRAAGHVAQCVSALEKNPMTYPVAGSVSVRTGFTPASIGIARSFSVVYQSIVRRHDRLAQIPGFRVPT
jgi:hypothetical protein